jgi:hypothetical protein
MAGRDQHQEPSPDGLLNAKEYDVCITSEDQVLLVGQVRSLRRMAAAVTVP